MFDVKISARCLEELCAIGEPFYYELDVGECVLLGFGFERLEKQ